MADIGASNWNETDASNTDAAPDGSPEGMAPSGVNNVLRAHQGAVKRFWNKINAVKTTGGTSSAYTLTYGTAPGAYYDGEVISFVVNAANAVDATLNVNALGAVPLRLFAGNLLAGALQANQIVQARYNSSAGAFDILTSPGWVRLGAQSPSGASTVNFTGIPAAVNHIRIEGEVRPSADGINLILRTYGADGVLDTGAGDYSYWILSNNSGGATPTTGFATTSSVAICQGVDNGTWGATFSIGANNIQAATTTKFQYRSQFLDSAGVLGLNYTGSGSRNEAARITGVRIAPSNGTVTGLLTLFASV